VDGAVRVGPRGGGVEASDTSHEWCVFDGNRTNVAIALRPGSHHVMIRDNLVRAEGGNAVMIYRPDAEGRVTSDVIISRNTGMIDGPKGRFLYVEGRADRITLTHNLYVAPNLTVASGGAPVFVGTGDFSAFARIDGNVWPDATPNRAGGGTMWMGTAGYLTDAAWNAANVVGDDAFTDDNVPAGPTYSLTLAGRTVGSGLRKAA
ncbi:MAG TPA: hypothetical protein VK324_04320, partial [Tepidisphaeraceae bacterium]|nr:hypothetical protein [Tepidisphaeraceae bacterium]